MPRIFPFWARDLGALLTAGVEVRFACPGCKRVFDVDLDALAMLRGPEWSLIDRRARCKANRCRARGWFIAAAGRTELFLILSSRTTLPPWLSGARPADHEPKPPPPPTPPVPIGVDKTRWLAATSDAERKRLVREARG